MLYESIALPTELNWRLEGLQNNSMPLPGQVRIAGEEPTLGANQRSEQRWGQSHCMSITAEIKVESFHPGQEFEEGTLWLNRQFHLPWKLGYRNPLSEERQRRLQERAP